ncbi:acyloxyacyl hydrolase-like isoform X1 [Mercenaria mercenaria]|uniref:acyloxyacyl hydrolase-like isoform X1 n=2 Tax=Mercenaria mercenaria TaxID=6596 RepID=UPI00234F1089|nr:acyloxyacyl hydrolase-like isoform X1 [Mercenaria mercenaria]
MEDSKRKILCSVLLVFICLIQGCHSDSNGGSTCATCDVLMGLVEQTAVIHNETLINSLERLCNYLPDQFKNPCMRFLEYIGPILIEIIEDGDTPDLICHKIGLCYTEKGRQCNLFPMKKNQRLYHYTEDPRLVKKAKRLDMPRIGAGICDLPGIKEICDWINLIFSDHEPAIDLDGDKHSPYETLRGYSWRGKDCDDERRSTHPGARPIDGDREVDSNCNGIKGHTPASNVPYENMFCAQSQPRGIAVLGDSISAHFHLPREWFNSTELSVANFEPLPFIGENELDWPELSYGTGFMNATEELSKVIHGHTDSLYLRLWQRNRCNFRDYQNIAVNGARASSMVDTIEKSLYRNMTGDYPLIVIYALVGNDVCNGHPDTIAHMTTPQDMKKYATMTLQYLEKNIPAGSYVFLTGLADGRVLYDNLKSRIHPIGSLRNDVTYAHFYDYFNCLEISPCTGWMNTNETLRNLTTKRAMELSAALQEVVTTTAGSYKNFKLYYNENPINKVINEWMAAGKPAYELLEPVDGFHANQRGNAEVARVVWEELLQKWPEAIGKENPFNDEIRDMFGDQGGYR